MFRIYQKYRQGCFHEIFRVEITTIRRNPEVVPNYNKRNVDNGFVVRQQIV